MLKLRIVFASNCVCILCAIVHTTKEENKHVSALGPFTHIVNVNNIIKIQFRSSHARDLSKPHKLSISP